MIKYWDVAIPQLTGNEKRRAYVYVPDSYYNNPEMRYPVLYMFDGHNVFFDSHASYGKSWGMLDYLNETGTQLIVAAVECNHSPDFGRMSEYSPYDFEDQEYGHIQGKGEITMQWFVDEFKPYIDANYPTIPTREYTFIGGSSMGGLMSIYALFAHNDVYSGALSMSPAVSFNPDEVNELIRNAKVDRVTDLYVDYGELELQGYSDRPELEYDLIEAITEKGICVTARLIPDGVHSEESWEKQLHIAIPSLLYRIDN